ncbi:MAG TPA: 1-acyl-sn-glycerol-3-phosphate acyltransferase [Candidatus Caccousia avistercoris]|nr:1-acyl-sn-glycerol-3-phosphate acyltransferase [Candidatus Caccousia avistercoris]
MKKTPLYAFGKVAAQPVVWPFIPYTVKGRENIPQDENFILCANHMGISDPLRLASIEKRQIYFMSKAELFQNKALAWLLLSLGCVPVQRGRGDMGAIDHAGEVLKRGDILGVFIEGTRSKTGELGQPKAGAVMLAYQHKKPILPVCLTPVGSRLPRMFHRVVVSYGSLIQPEELGIQEGKGSEYRNASRLVMSKIAALRERDLKEMEA